jgi:hypothetical protein
MGTVPVYAVAEQVAPLVGDVIVPPLVRYVAICRSIVVPEYNAGTTELLTFIVALAARVGPFAVAWPTPLFIVSTVLPWLS